jgi:hypothetical protein
MKVLSEIILPPKMSIMSRVLWCLNRVGAPIKIKQLRASAKGLEERCAPIPIEIGAALYLARSGLFSQDAALR